MKGVVRVGAGLGGLSRPYPNTPSLPPRRDPPPRMWGADVTAGNLVGVRECWGRERLLVLQARGCDPVVLQPKTPPPSPPPSSPIILHPTSGSSLVGEIRKSGTGWRRRGEGLGATIAVAGMGRVFLPPSSGELRRGKTLIFLQW